MPMLMKSYYGNYFGNDGAPSLKLGEKKVENNLEKGNWIYS